LRLLSESYSSYIYIYLFIVNAPALFMMNVENDNVNSTENVPTETANGNNDTRFDDIKDGLGDLDDLGGGTTGDIEVRPVKKNRAALEFENFVGETVKETKTVNEETATVETSYEKTPYDKIWNDLFLKRVALFPTLEEASMQALKRMENNDNFAPGTLPWYVHYQWQVRMDLMSIFVMNYAQLHLSVTL